MELSKEMEATDNGMFSFNNKFIYPIRISAPPTSHARVGIQPLSLPFILFWNVAWLLCPGAGLGQSLPQCVVQPQVQQ